MHFGDRHPLTLVAQVNEAVHRGGRRASSPRPGRSTSSATAELSDVLGPITRTRSAPGSARHRLRPASATPGGAEPVHARCSSSAGRPRRAADPARDGGEHPYLLMRAINLSYDLRATGDRERADALFAESVAGLRHALGPDHPEVVAIEQGTRTEGDIEPPPT